MARRRHRTYEHPGRPVTVGPAQDQRRICVRLLADEVEALLRLGAGSISRGIRALLLDAGFRPEPK